MTNQINLAILNQIDLERFKASQIRRYIPKLNAAIDDIEALVLRLQDKNKKEQDKIHREIRDIIDKAYLLLEKDMQKQLLEFIEEELKEESNTLPVTISKVELGNIATSLLSGFILGASLSDHLKVQNQQTKMKIERLIRQGLSDNLTTPQIYRQIRGTKSRKFRDGAINASLNHLSSIISTAIQTYSNQAKIAVWRRSDVKKYIWLSVLDSRTTHICRGRSNKVYIVGSGPLPPAHWRCRSTISPYEVDMEVPESYTDWLRSQPREVVEDVLGKKKANIFLSTDLTLDRFSVNGRELTLQELKQKRSANA